MKHQAIDHTLIREQGQKLFSGAGDVHGKDDKFWCTVKFVRVLCLFLVGLLEVILELVDLRRSFLVSHLCKPVTYNTRSLDRKRWGQCFCHLTYILEYRHKMRAAHVVSRPFMLHNHLPLNFRRIRRRRCCCRPGVDVDHTSDHALQPLEPRRHAPDRFWLLGPRRVDAQLRRAAPFDALAARRQAVALQLRGAAVATTQEHARALYVRLLAVIAARCSVTDLVHGVSAGICGERNNK